MERARTGLNLDDQGEQVAESWKYGTDEPDAVEEAMQRVDEGEPGADEAEESGR